MIDKINKNYINFNHLKLFVIINLTLHYKNKEKYPLKILEL